MVCVTDDERRAAASLLRSFADGGMWGEFIDYCSSAGPSRLADLIEPSCDATATHTDATATRDVSQTRRSDVDRDALLAIADYACPPWYEEPCETCPSTEENCKNFCFEYALWDTARRIREACGVMEDD